MGWAKSERMELRRREKNCKLSGVYSNERRNLRSFIKIKIKSESRMIHTTQSNEMALLLKLLQLSEEAKNEILNT